MERREGEEWEQRSIGRTCLACKKPWFQFPTLRKYRSGVIPAQGRCRQEDPEAEGHLQI